MAKKYFKKCDRKNLKNRSLTWNSMRPYMKTTINDVTIWMAFHWSKSVSIMSNNSN